MTKSKTNNAPSTVEGTEQVVLVKDQFHKMAEIKRSLSPDQIKVIKDTIAPSLNDSELAVFLYRAQKLELDPLNGEIFAYASGTPRKLTIIVARDGKRVIAERTKLLEYIDTKAIYRVKNKDESTYRLCEPWEGGELWGALCVVKRTDIDKPYEVTVPLSEYKLNRDVWNTKPETMIKKVAESQALSAAFPQMVGVYDEAERWDEPKELPVLVDDNDSIDEGLKNTLKGLGEEVKKDMTKGEARRVIASYAQKGRKK